jgi:hypothetical protein
VSPVKYEVGFYVPEDGILHSHCRANVITHSINVLNMNSASYGFESCYGDWVSLLSVLMSSLSLLDPMNRRYIATTMTTTCNIPRKT